MSEIDREAALREIRNLKPRFENVYGVTKIGIFGSWRGMKRGMTATWMSS